MNTLINRYYLNLKLSKPENIDSLINEAIEKLKNKCSSFNSIKIMFNIMYYAESRTLVVKSTEMFFVKQYDSVVHLHFDCDRPTYYTGKIPATTRFVQGNVILKSSQLPIDLQELQIYQLHIDQTDYRFPNLLSKVHCIIDFDHLPALNIEYRLERTGSLFTQVSLKHAFNEASGLELLKNNGFSNIKYDAITQLTLHYFNAPQPVFPRALKKLIMIEYNQPLHHLPWNLQELKLVQFNNVICLPDDLRVLNMKHYNRDFMEPLPEYLMVLHLSRFNGKFNYAWPDHLLEVNLERYNGPLQHEIPSSLHVLKMPSMEYHVPGKIEHLRFCQMKNFTIDSFTRHSSMMREKLIILYFHLLIFKYD